MFYNGCMTDDVHDSIGQQVDLLDRWVEVRRKINTLEAEAARLLGERLESMDADIAASPASSRRVIERSMIAEYSAASRISKGSIEYSIGEARMVGCLPSIMASFQAGRISLQHVRNILRAAGTVQSGVNDGTVEPAVLGLFEQAALEYAESEAAARTDAHVKELAAALVPVSVVEQNRRGEKERRTWIRTFEDGMSLIQMLLPTVKAEAVMDRASALAKEALAASDAANPAFRLPIDWDAEFAEWQAHQAEDRAANTGEIERVWVPEDQHHPGGSGSRSSSPPPISSNSTTTPAPPAKPQNSPPSTPAPTPSASSSTRTTGQWIRRARM